MKKVPNLRFPEFSGEWEIKKTINIFDKVKNSVDVEENINYRQLGIRSHGKGLFYKDEVTGKELGNKRVFWVEPNVFIVNIVFAWERAVARTTEKERGMIASHRFPMYKPKDSILDLDYITYFFKTNKGKTLLELASPGGAGRNKTLGQKEFDDLNIILPKFDEQKKIGSILLLIDKKIEKQQEKVEALKYYKKGIMQKIFSQEIRFKGDNGQDYPEWETTTIEKIAFVEKGFTPDTSNDSYWNGDIPWLSIADMKQGKYLTQVSKYISKDILKNNKLIPINTLIMSFKLTIGRLGIVKEKMITNEAICHFYWKDTNVNTEYMYYYLSTVRIESFGCRAAKGITLNNDSLNAIVVKLPLLEEQKQIAEFLTKLDQKLDKEKEKLDYLNQWKKGLLQQMFV